MYVVFKHDFEFNTLMPEQNGQHFAGDIFKYIYIEKCHVFIEISLKGAKTGNKFLHIGCCNRLTFIIHKRYLRNQSLKLASTLFI